MGMGMMAKASNRHSCLPDPCEPLDNQGGDGGAAMGKRRLKAAETLAAARGLIIELRFTGFTVRGLAQSCGLSTQALHSRLGSRDAIIAAAINDYSLALYRHGGEAMPQRNAVLSFVHAFADACEAYPEFFRRILPNTYFERSGAQVFERTHAYGTLLIHGGLAAMRRQSRIAESADLRVAATAISTLMGATLLDWARGSIRTAELRRQMLYKVDLLMTGLENR